MSVFITAKKGDAYTKVRQVAFGSDGPSKFTARVGTTHNKDVFLNVRLDSPRGKSLGTVKVPLTGGNDRWAFVTMDVPKVTGAHDLYFVFNGKAETDILSVDYGRFVK